MGNYVYALRDESIVGDIIVIYVTSGHYYDDESFSRVCEKAKSVVGDSITKIADYLINGDCDDTFMEFEPMGTYVMEK